MNKGNLINTIYNPVLETNTKSFLDNLDLENLKSNCTNGTIKKGMEYRPDLVALHYLNDSTMGWLITYVNDFYDGIKDYKLGREIKIPVLS